MLQKKHVTIRVACFFVMETRNMRAFYEVHSTIMQK